MDWIWSYRLVTIIWICLIFIKFLLSNRIIGKAMENRLVEDSHLPLILLFKWPRYWKTKSILMYICIKDSESRPRHNQFTVIHFCFTVASQVVQITNLNENRVQTGLLFEWDIKIQNSHFLDDVSIWANALKSLSSRSYSFTMHLCVYVIISEESSVNWNCWYHHLITI